VNTTSDLARAVLDRARDQGLLLSTAESCTGGLVAAALTDIPGSSDVFDRGFVTYSNEAKQEMLGVPAETLQAHGAVSEATARLMALGAVKASRADAAVSITGIAGPGGGSPEKPVGLVCFAAVRRGEPVLTRVERYGDIGRAEVRAAAAETALRLLLEVLG
jgi:nicotinamide-nucleotide amidase